MYKIFIGNLISKTTHKEVKSILHQVVRVKSAGFIKTRELPPGYVGAISEESSGSRPPLEASQVEALPSEFRVVELATKKEARTAIQVLKAAQLKIRPGQPLLLFGPHKPIGEP